MTFTRLLFCPSLNTESFPPVGWFIKVRWTFFYISLSNLLTTSFHSIDIDDCVSNACENDGSCVDGINGYTWNCKDGFTGEKCETGELINNVVSDFVGKATKV